MNHKVLLADDSLTIQKVIKITLANQPFDLVDCASDDALFKMLPGLQPDLVLLDFNLSENDTGYELSSKIKALAPSTKILLLLGTFDTIDDALMEKSGASDKIVKPFDSNKFIAICKRLVDTSQLEEVKFPEIKPKEIELPKQDDQWQMNHSTERKSPPVVVAEPTKIFDVRDHLNLLDQEVSDWGMSVPNIINDTTPQAIKIDLPPVITSQKTNPEVKTSQPINLHTEEAKFPESNDLDYPTIEELEASEPATPVTESKPKSKLISIESFNRVTDTEFEIEHAINSVPETDISSIVAQISDEVDDHLWKVDEFEDLKKEVSSKIEEVKNNFQPTVNDFDESLFKPLDSDEEIQWNTPLETSSFENTENDIFAPVKADVVSHELILSELRSEMDDLIKKHVKEYMDQMFKAKVEKISWEVIPDLAENLIRQEISKISNKILNDSN